MPEGQSPWRARSSALPESDFTSRIWPRFLRGPDPRLLEDLYVPALQRSLRYDRCCAYFSSSVLSTAARGFSGLIRRFATDGNSLPRPAVRLLVNEQLTREDVEALSDTPDPSALEKVLIKRFASPETALEKARLEMLAWMVSRELVEIRVGVLRSGEGILHAKFGVFHDENGTPGLQWKRNESVRIDSQLRTPGGIDPGTRKIQNLPKSSKGSGGQPPDVEP